MNRRGFVSGTLMARSAAGLFLAASQRAGNAAGGKLVAGASLSNITPALGCSLAGNMTNEIATAIHDDLFVRSLVLDNGQTKLALAICDLCVLPREVID